MAPMTAATIVLRLPQEYLRSCYRSHAIGGGGGGLNRDFRQMLLTEDMIVSCSVRVDSVTYLW